MEVQFSQSQSDERISYRVSEVARLTGVSEAMILRLVKSGVIRKRKLDGVVLLNPQDVHRVFGFKEDEEVAPSREALAEMEELLQ